MESDGEIRLDLNGDEGDEYERIGTPEDKKEEEPLPFFEGGFQMDERLRLDEEEGFLARIRIHRCNEKNTTELLRLSPTLLKDIEQLAEFLHLRNEELEQFENTKSIRYIILKTEVSRLQYLLTDLHRARVRKISTQLRHILKGENEDRLTPLEKTFALE